MKKLLIFCIALLPSIGAASFIDGGGSGVDCSAASNGLVYTAQGDGTCAFDSVAGTGDVVGPASSVNNEMALFSGTSGKSIARASGTGVCKASSGVVSFGDVDLTAEVTGALPVANGGTNSSTALNNDRVMVSSSGAVVESGTIDTTELGYLNGVSSAIQTQLDGKAPSDGDGIVDHICFHIETPDDKPYYLVAYAHYPFTIDSIVTDVDSGTANGALEVDGTPVTGCTSSDISISSTEATNTCSGGNTVSVGETVELVITSNSSAAELRGCVKITRD